MPPKQNKELIERMNQAFNTGTESIVDELVDPQHTDRTPFPGTGKDQQGLKQQIRALRSAFPDAQFTIEEMVAEGETVAFRWKMVGTHRGKLMGQDGTNKRVTHSGIDIVTFKNGKIVEHRSSDNVPTLLAKLGLQFQVTQVLAGHEE